MEKNKTENLKNVVTNSCSKIKGKVRRENRGITLVALIITIIVMLILVAVTVSVVINSNLIGTAQDATNKYKNALSEESTLPDYINQYVDTLVHSGVVHNGAIYKVATYNETTGEYTYTELEAGEKFPEVVSVGDIYVYGDYEYRYKQYWELSNGWVSDTNQNGWAARVLDTTKATYGNILESINEKTVGCVSGTFRDCTTLTTSPVIPKSVTCMTATFAECSSLTTAPTIPNSVTDIGGIFAGCTSLKTYIGSTDADGDFSGYVIPNGVVKINHAFNRCGLITTAPVIPNSVTNMQSTFYSCISLTGIITINATNIDNYQVCFKNTTQPIIITGTCPQLAEIAATANNGNVTVQ